MSSRPGAGFGHSVAPLQNVSQMIVFLIAFGASGRHRPKSRKGAPSYVFRRKVTHQSGMAAQVREKHYAVADLEMVVLSQRLRAIMVSTAQVREKL